MELCFFQEYLKRKFKVKDQNIKSNISREIWWHLVIFWHPGMWKERYRGWDCCFSSEATFIDLSRKIQSSQHLIKDSHATTYTYLCLTDKDKSTSEGKITSAKKYIDQYCSRYTWDIIPLYAIQEIETRFLAWLWEIFKQEYSWVKDKQLSDFFRKNNNIEEKIKAIKQEILEYEKSLKDKFNLDKQLEEAEKYINNKMKEIGNKLDFESSYKPTSQ